MFSTEVLSNILRYFRIENIYHSSAGRTVENRQVLDVTLIERDLTVVLNGRKVIDKGTAEGFTAPATDWREAEPGTIALQRDCGSIEFGKLLIRQIKRF